MREKVKSLIEYPLLIIVGAFLCAVFFCYIFLSQKEKSEWENRYLSKRPEIIVSDLVSGKYMTDFESYVNDQVLGRDIFIKIKAVSESLLLKSVNNGIVKAKSGNLFSEDLSDDDNLKKNFAAIHKFVKEIGRPVAVAIAPNATEMLKDELPKGMPVKNQSEKIADFYSDISLLDNVRVVDLIGALNGHEDEYIYYGTDHHWTSLGAYYAYDAISTDPITFDKLNFHEIDDFYGTLYAKYKGIGVRSDVISYADLPIESAVFGEINTDTLYDLSKADVFDKYALFLYGNYGFSEIVSDKDNEKTLVIFKDSYANSVIPYLTCDYGRIVIVDLRYYGESVKSLLEKEANADILLLYNFDFVNEDKHFYKLVK